MQKSFRSMHQNRLWHFIGLNAFQNYGSFFNRRIDWLFDLFILPDLQSVINVTSLSKFFV